MCDDEIKDGELIYSIIETHEVQNSEAQNESSNDEM